MINPIDTWKVGYLWFGAQGYGAGDTHFFMFIHPNTMLNDGGALLCARWMRGEERHVVGDRLLNARGFDGQVAEISPGKLRALPGYLTARLRPVCHPSAGRAGGESEALMLKDDLLKLLPIGEENAVSARLIWEQLGMWSSPSVRHKLNELAAKGLIKRRKVEQASGPVFLYYKPTD